jgi:hypothetical protein
MTQKEDLNGKHFWTCYNCNFELKASRLPIAEMPFRKKLPWYFVHGIALTLLLAVLEIVWAFSAVILTMIGAWLGIIIAIAFLILLFGGINIILAAYIWGFSMQTSFWSVLTHGIVLFVLLFAVDLIFLIPTLWYEVSLLVQVATFLISCFPSGLIGEKIAEKWRA